MSRVSPSFTFFDPSVPDDAPPPAGAVWTLALFWCALVVHASLYPFSGWRSTGLPWFGFVTAPWPHYWTWFDLWSNVVGYIPLGFLLALAWLYSAKARWAAVALACLAGSGLSLCMESTQVWIAARTPSNVDWAANTLGTVLGALCMAGLHRAGVLTHWLHRQHRWILPHAHGAIVLVVLWVVALLYPSQIPYGMGQVMERLENLLYACIQGSSLVAYLPLREVEYQPLTAMQQACAVACGLMVPVLLLYGAVPHKRHRLVPAAVWAVAALCVPALVYALVLDPARAWSWLWPPVWQGWCAALVLLLMCLWLPVRACWWLLLPVLGAELALVNGAAMSGYHEWLLEIWQRPGFIHFYGLTQWLNWAWPFAAVAYCAVQLYRRLTTWPALPDDIPTGEHRP